MARDFERMWKDIASPNDEARAVRALAEILTEKEGRTFISSLERDDAEVCIDVLDNVSSNCVHSLVCNLKRFGQGIAGHRLNATERQIFLIALRRLAESHGRLPDSMVITEKIEIEPKVLANGGFADVRLGRHMGCLVAVKTLRVPATSDIQMVKKVSVNVG